MNFLLKPAIELEDAAALSPDKRHYSAVIYKATGIPDYPR